MEPRGIVTHRTQGPPDSLPVGPQHCPNSHQSPLFLKFQTKFITSFSGSSGPKF